MPKRLACRVEVKPADAWDATFDYRALFDGNPNPILVFDSETLRIVDVNDAAVRTYGYPREEFLEMTIEDIRPPEDLAHLHECLANPGKGYPGGKRSRHRKRDGTVMEVQVFGLTVQFAGRRARLSIIQDVTHQRHLEEQLRHSQKLEAAGLLAGGIAHDFNNLLSIVLGSSELARRAVGASTSPAEHLESISSAASRAAELTRKLLAFSRKQVMKMRPLELNQALVEVTRLLQRVVGEDVALEFRASASPLVVRADPSQLEQVLLNLCTNARQAMPRGGRLVIETRRAGFDDAFVERNPWARVGEFAELRVTDSGEGMDEPTRRHIFEPFFTTKKEGTGLGLAVVHGIVQQHEGFLDVESTPGAGTSMHVYLPLTREKALAEVARSEGADVPRRGHELVLVAEDERPLRNLLLLSLEELGYEVLTAADGEEATRVFEANRSRIDLVILDVVMPRLGGPEALARMRVIEPSLRAILTTGHAPDTAFLSELAEAGALTILPKPFALDELGRKVGEMLQLAPRTGRAVRTVT